MTNKEMDRVTILTEVIEGKISQLNAAKKLKLSDRQVRRLITKFKREGRQAIISKKRNKPSNRCLPSELKSKTINLVESHYVDFGPTLANEYLKKEHDIFISTEILRLWMIEKKLWISRRSNKKLHPPRPRRRAFGELIQIDGSDHDWFEGRSPPCTLMVFIDDATSAITALHFSPTESLEAYYCTLEKHLKTYSVPLSFYGDRCSVLTPRQPKDVKDGTQFQKALKELDCQLILALSPQAKGRIERANRTLQDRLVKELRLKGISTIDEANLMIEEYRKRYNQLFSKKPNEQMDVHRPLEGISLEHILCTREVRTLNNNCFVQFKNNFYQISNQDEKMCFPKKAKIEIRQCLSGKLIAMFKGKIVKMTQLEEIESPVIDEKQFITWKPRKVYIPPLTHPYKVHYPGGGSSQLQNVI